MAITGDKVSKSGPSAGTSNSNYWWQGLVPVLAPVMFITGDTTDDNQIKYIGVIKLTYVVTIASREQMLFKA